ncbi:MAG: amino acid ABC transporter permease [Actinomycetaceae bacterium]|nr:amino acid ABC transporter permease [Actinomycetaceae bacterium]
MSTTHRLFDQPGPRGRRRIAITSAFTTVVIVGLAAGGLYNLWWHYQLEPDMWLPFFEGATLRFFGTGVYGTLLATVVAALFSFPLALVLALGRLSSSRIISRAVGAWVETFRALPLLLVVYAFLLALPKYGVTLPIFWLLVGPMIISSSASTAEVFRAGIRAVPRGQTEAGLSLGLTARQTRWHIVIPQAIRMVLPNLLTSLVSLLKDSTLGYVVSYYDLMFQGQLYSAQSTAYIQTFFLVAMVYVAVNMGLTHLARRWQKI